MIDNLTLIEKLLPYLRILNEKRLAVNKSSKAAAEHLLSLRWAVQARQKSFVEITDKGLEFIPEYLSNQWEVWREYQDRLIEAGFDFNIEAVKELERREKLLAVNLPKRIHHKTLAAILGIHSKTGISKGLSEKLTETTITTDQSLRFYANRGMTLSLAGGKSIDCDYIMSVIGEVSLPERSFLDGIRISGARPKAIFTIENRGSFIDFPRANKDILVIHAPGNDLDLARRLLMLVPSSIPVFHFGDLDPKGLDIFRCLSSHSHHKTSLFVPACWREHYNKSFSKPKKWPVEAFWGKEIPIINTLIEDEMWLEQEKIALDPRLKDEIEIALNFSFQYE